jgi:hypothetical protein
MARTERENVDYFPFLCKEGPSMFIIETKFGNDGYATWVKILRELAVTNKHYLDLSTTQKIKFLAAKCRISETKLFEIIDELCDLEEINVGLWKDKKVVWCDKFIENIQDAYKRRNNKCITLNELMLLLNYKCSTLIQETPQNLNGNTHIILDKNITDKIRGYYFKIQGKIFQEKVSEYMQKHCVMFMEQLDMKIKIPTRAEVFEKLDSEKATYDFDDENHIKNTYKTMKQNWKANKLIIQEQSQKKSFNEKL